MDLIRAASSSMTRWLRIQSYQPPHLSQGKTSSGSLKGHYVIWDTIHRGRTLSHLLGTTDEEETEVTYKGREGN